MVDETVLGSVVLGLERAEERLFSTENLHSTGRVLGKVHKATSVADEACADELANERCEVRGDSCHAILEVGVKLGAVGSDADDLVAQAPNVVDVGVGNFGTHTDLSSRLERFLDLLGQNGGEIGRGSVCAEAHGANDLGVCDVVGDDLTHLGEVPAVPFLELEQRDSL